MSPLVTIALALLAAGLALNVAALRSAEGGQPTRRPMRVASALYLAGALLLLARAVGG